MVILECLSLHDQIRTQGIVRYMRNNHETFDNDDPIKLCKYSTPFRISQLFINRRVLFPLIANSALVTEYIVTVHHHQQIPKCLCPFLGGRQALDGTILALSDVKLASKVVEI